MPKDDGRELGSGWCMGENGGYLAVIAGIVKFFKDGLDRVRFSVHS
jgi:hypothetical protein